MRRLAAADDDIQLDGKYRKLLYLLKSQILNLSDSTEVAICIKWIQRFSEAQPEEKLERNRLASLLLEQLADNNLNYPFIFVKKVDQPLGVLVSEIGRSVDNFSIKTEGSSQTELVDILANVKDLLCDAETLNLRVEEDLYSIRSDRNDSVVIQRFSNEIEQLTEMMSNLRSQLEYHEILKVELKHLLTQKLPQLIEFSDVEISLNDNLQPADVDWIKSAVQCIRNQIFTLRKSTADDTPKACVATQTGYELDSFNLESFYERKFARLREDFLLREHARQMELTSRDGLKQIDLSRNFAKVFRKKKERTCELELLLT